MRPTVIIIAMLFATSAFAQQAQPESKYLLRALQAQRDQNANQAAMCGAENTRLQEELAALKAKLATIETPSSVPAK